MDNRISFNGLPRKRNITLRNDEESKQTDIDSLLQQYNDCLNSINSLKKKDTSKLPEAELFRYNKAFNLIIKKKKIISDKLLVKGYKTEKRGRPTKDESTKYKSTHTRISCYFTESNAKYLNELKESGIIDNISAFLNKMLDDYFNYKDGAIDEK